MIKKETIIIKYIMKLEIRELTIIWDNIKNKMKINQKKKKKKSYLNKNKTKKIPKSNIQKNVEML